MGLDMYLKTKRSVYLRNGEHIIDLDNFDTDFDNYHEDEFGCSNRVTISEYVGYWRKANAIHRWFVDNIQDGKDECQESYVSKEDIEKLLSVCNNILDKIEGCEFFLGEDAKKHHTDIRDKFVFHKKYIKYIYSKYGLFNFHINLTKDTVDFINENLPPQKGFFFGTTDINGNYFYDVIKTVLIIDRLKKMMKKWEKENIYTDIYYYASW